MVSDKRKLAFAKRLTEALARRGLDAVSGEEFSKLLARHGISVSGQTVSNWRTGKHMPKTLHEVEVLAGLLDVEPAELAFGTARVAEPSGGRYGSEAAALAGERHLVDMLALLGEDERNVVGEMVRLLVGKSRGDGKRAGRPRKRLR